MYQLDFQRPIHIHMIGIGGISMSGLAHILLDAGFTLSGSDRQATDLTAALEARGVRISYDQSQNCIAPETKAVVYTAAIGECNPEYAHAKAAGLPLLSRAQLLGQLMTNYRHALAIAGTHGKTTTTSMVAHILLEGDCDPTISVGGVLPAIGGNIRVGGTDTFLTEACEYTDSFLSFSPTHAVILNIEEDHMDYFSDLAQIRRSFHAFMERVHPQGLVVLNADIADIAELTNGITAATITFGACESATYQYRNLYFDEHGLPHFEVWTEGQLLGQLQLQVPGEYNVANAMAALALAHRLGYSFELIARGLFAFGGTNRRFERKGDFHGVTVIDDYAHHPTEIRAALAAATAMPHQRLIVVFQSHTYSRTKAFLNEFAEALTAADLVLLPDIYAAREQDTLGVSSADICQRLQAMGTEAHYLPGFDEVIAFLKKNCINGDLLITMGAGDVVNIGERLLNE